MNSFHVRLAFLLLHCITITTLTSALICPKTNGKDPTDVTGRLNALVKANPNYQFTESVTNYFYKWQICASVAADTNAIVQSGGKNKQGPISLGTFPNSRLVGGTDWFMITYPNGQKYGTHCGGQARKSSVMVTCDPNAVKGTFKILEEYRDSNNSKVDECYYLFELNNKAACTVKPPDNSLSAGSILIIVIIIVGGVYLILGFLYQRYVAGAKGLEQIPNYQMWIKFGGLQADGCDFLCRCNKKKTRSPTYKPVEDALADDFHQDPDDDNLLPAV